jgi:hypothetical protein
MKCRTKGKHLTSLQAIALLDRSVVLSAVEEQTARTSEPFEARG